MSSAKRPEAASVTPGLAAWIVAVAIALLAQWELTPLDRPGPAALLFLVAATVAVVGARWIDRVAPLGDPMRRGDAGCPTDPKRHSRQRAAAGTVAVALGLVLTAVSVDLVTARDSSSIALPLWLIALAAVSLGTGLLGSFPWRLPHDRASALEAVGVGTIVLLAFGLRAWHLTAIPVDVHGDEAAVGLAARQILNGNARDLFGVGWASLPRLSFAASALAMQAFGDDLLGLRLASAIVGSLSVALLYGVAKRLFSTRVAALSATFLATAQMAIHYSRTGNNYIQALFASLLIFYFLLRALQNRQWLDYLFAGFAVGIALSVYLAARLTPVLALLYLLHRAIGEREFLGRHGRGLTILALGAWLFVAPQMIHYLGEPADALTRTSEVFVLSPDNLAHEYGAYQVHSIADVLRVQAVNTLEAFNLRGETSNQYGQTGPLLDFGSGALLVLGAAIATTRLRQSRYFLLAAWLWLTLLLGSVLDLDALFSPHVVAMLGTLAVLPALVVETGWRALASRRPDRGWRFGLPVVMVVVVLIGWSNYVDYFEVHVQTMEPPSFFTILARYVQTVNGRYRVYLLADRDTSLAYDTVHFLVPRIDGVNVRDFPLSLPLRRVPDHKGVIFLERDAKDPRYAALRREYPRGVEEPHRNLNGYLEFYSYQVERSELLAADPEAFVDHAPIPATDLDQLNPR
ncbi:MAG: ArnT family glycosyltransferase [Chloroflexota bacterium]